MPFVFLLALALAGAGKPMVSLEESCRKASAVLVVEPAGAGTYLVHQVLYDGAKAGFEKGATVAVDLGGMVYEQDRVYILFLEPTADARRHRAVPQMRTEDSKETRARVLKLLEAKQANPQRP